MAAPARRLARAPRRALTEAQILRLVRFPAIRRAISGGLARVAPISVDIPKGGRFVRFRLAHPRLFHPALYATMPLGGRGTLGVIGTKLSAVKRRGELASFIRRMGARLKGTGRKGMIYQLRSAGIIGPSTLQAVLVPKARVEQIVARFAASPRLRKVVGNPILATLGLNPLDRGERAQLLRRSRMWDRAAKDATNLSVRQFIRGHAEETRSIARASKISDLWGTQRRHAKMNPRRRARRNDEGKPIVFSGPEQTSAYRMIALKHALKLEILGMKRRGPSAFSIIKSEFKLKGSKQAVLDQYSKMVEDLVQGRAKPPGFNPRRRTRRNGDPFPMLNRGRRSRRHVCNNPRHRHGARRNNLSFTVSARYVAQVLSKLRPDKATLTTMQHRWDGLTVSGGPADAHNMIVADYRKQTGTNPGRRGRRVRRNEGTQQINVPFRDGQKITPARMRAWLRSLPEGQIKRNIVRRFDLGMKQYKRFHLGAEPKSFTYRAVQMGSAGKQITDVDVVVSEGKEWAATYQVPRHSRKYEGKGADGRYIHTHGDESGAELEVDIKRPAAKRLLPERFHTADGKFVGVVPTRNVRITDWYRG